MTLHIKKTIGLLLLGFSFLPSFSFAAASISNPFDSVQMSTDPTTPSAPASTVIPQDTQTLSTPSANSNPSTSAFSSIVTENKDIKSEARPGEDNPGRYEKLSEFANRFNDKIFGGGNGTTQI